jgi:hypothetical protein
MHKDYQAHTSLNPPLICGEFDTKIKLLYGKMALEVINVLEPFQAFVMTSIVLHTICVPFNSIQGLRGCNASWSM